MSVQSVQSVTPSRSFPVRRRCFVHALSLAALVLSGAACERERHRTVTAEAPTTSLPPQSASIAPSGAAPIASAVPSAAPSETALPALKSEPYVELELDKFGSAVVAVPVGATERRFVVVALHGNFDRPEWQCQIWRDITPRSFVLCPRGVRRSDTPASDPRFTYEGGSERLLAEIRAGQAALTERFGDYLVDDGKTAIYAGFSLGAILGIRVLAEHAAEFPSAVLIEGGYERWTPGLIAAFARGGKRVLFACAQTACRNAARRLGPTFEHHGVVTELAYAPGAGHTYDGPVAEAIRERLDEWLQDKSDAW